MPISNSFETRADGVIWRGDGETLLVQAWGPDSLRIRSAQSMDVVDTDYALLPPTPSRAEVTVDGDRAILSNGRITAHLLATTALDVAVGYEVMRCGIEFRDADGAILLRELDAGGSLKLKARAFQPIIGGDHKITASFDPNPGAKLYGMGQLERAAPQVEDVLLVLAHPVELLAGVRIERRSDLVVAADDRLEGSGLQLERAARVELAQQDGAVRVAELNAAPHDLVPDGDVERCCRQQVGGDPPVAEDGAVTVDRHLRTARCRRKQRVIGVDDIHGLSAADPQAVRPPRLDEECLTVTAPDDAVGAGLEAVADRHAGLLGRSRDGTPEAGAAGRGGVSS